MGYESVLGGRGLKDKELRFYMQTAENAAQMSHAVRKKVGACVITKNRGIYIGYNGRLVGQDNSCEYKSYNLSTLLDGSKPFVYEHQDEIGDYNLVTRKDVVHGEMNALAKMLKEGVSAEDATLVVTLAPCATCAVMIASAGIKEVIYKEKYRDEDGLKILIDSNVIVKQFNEEFQ